MIRIVVNDQHPKVPCPAGRTYTHAEPGHPFVHWLAGALPRWFTFDPYIRYERPLLVDDPKMIQMGDVLLCSAAQAEELRRALPPAPAFGGRLAR